VDERYAFSTLKNPKEEITRYCNTDESGIGRTTPVWTYPQGISPNGVMDMSGNVWEWQGNLYRSGQDWWALRGGSWLDDCRYARVSGRDYDYWVGPRLDIIGFRLVSLPVH
jgi:formylglycine-generating enzyme required for sulfatase activity